MGKCPYRRDSDLGCGYLTGTRVINFTVNRTSPLIPRPHEHHVFDVLHAIKAAFKKDALDRLDERDCFNPEALR